MLLCTKSLFLVLASLSASDARLLFFTMDGCPPCRQTEPNIDRLAAEGFAVEKIDIQRQPQLAAQMSIKVTPSILMVRDNRVVMRHEGPLTYADLRYMFQKVAPDRGQTPTPRPARASTGQPAALVSHSASHSPLTPETRAQRASVRLRVQDAGGTSYATGTIIHRQNAEALVLTCGHVFRATRGQGKIIADIGFAGPRMQTVEGRLLFYDSETHDIALVTIPCPLSIEPVPVAPPSLVVQSGDRVFSLGCDRGEAPSIRPSAVKAISRYSGVNKYDTVGRPVDGRSGGGLFTAGGQLIGVCNAAAVEVDEGIYSGLPSIYWQFESTRLAHLFQPPTTSQAPTHVAEVRPLMAAPGSGFAAGDRTLAVNQHTAEAVRPVSTEPAAHRGSDVEVIMLIRSKSNPQHVETITVSNPSSDLLRLIEIRRGAELTIQQNAMAGRREMPLLNASAISQPPALRTQSPR